MRKTATYMIALAAMLILSIALADTCQAQWWQNLINVDKKIRRFGGFQGYCRDAYSALR